MSAIHMAALYGEVDAVRELLNHVPSYLKSTYPSSEASGVVKEFGNDADLTPLHLASFAGCDDAVRALLNSPATSVDAKSTPRGFTAVHCACLGGHIGVVELLLSRLTSLLQVQGVILSCRF